MKSLFEICVPRDDIRSGSARDSDFTFNVDNLSGKESN